MKKSTILILFLVISGCSRSVVVRRQEYSTLQDIPIKTGQVSPIDGVVLSWQRYEHLLLKEAD